MGMAASTAGSNDEMVDNLIEANSLTSRQFELAYRLVDRGRFVPQLNIRKSAYDDSAWRAHPTEPGHIHLSAPSIYGTILEHFELRRGLSFLNIGSGSGYFSTIVGFLIGENGTNHGVELFEKILEFGENGVARTLKTAAPCAYDWCIPEFFCGNAFQLRTERRYDRIYCGAMVPRSRRSFFCNLLNVNGILIMPYGNNLHRVVRRSETVFSIQNITSVQFASFEQPNPSNDYSMRPITIGLPSPPRLEEICRRAIRAYVRENLIADGYGLEMRYKCAEEKISTAPDNGGDSNAGSSSTPCPFMTAGRGESSSAGGSNENRGNEANANQTFSEENPAPLLPTTPPIIRRRLFIGRAAHRERVEHLLGMLDDRVVRHRNAQARNATTAVVNDSRRSLLELQRDRERRRDNDQQLLDDADFELIKGFTFESIGNVAVDDELAAVDDELAGMEDDDNIADIHRLHHFWERELPRDNEDDDLRSNHDNDSDSSATSNSSNNSGNVNDDEEGNTTNESTRNPLAASSSLRRSRVITRRILDIATNIGTSRSNAAESGSSTNRESNLAGRRGERNTIHLRIQRRRMSASSDDGGRREGRQRQPTTTTTANESTIRRNVGGGSLVIRLFANGNTAQNQYLRSATNSLPVVASNSRETNTENTNSEKSTDNVGVEGSASSVHKSDESAESPDNSSSFEKDFLLPSGSASTSVLSAESTISNFRNGKRLRAPSYLHSLKRSRSDINGAEDETLEQTEKMNFSDALIKNENNTSKIEENGIGHALDEPMEYQDQEKSVSGMPMVEDVRKDVSELKNENNLEQNKNNSDSEGVGNNITMAIPSLPTTMLNGKDLNEELSKVGTSRTVYSETSTRNSRQGRPRFYRSDIRTDDDDANIIEDVGGEGNVRGRIVGRPLNGAAVALGRQASLAAHSNTDVPPPISSSDETVSTSRDSKQSTKPSEVEDDDDEDDETGTDSEVREREEAVQRQMASLETFRRAFEKRLQQLPIAARMRSFLNYE